MGKTFEHIANQLEVQIRSAIIESTTEMTLVFHLLDEDGNTAPEIREDLVGMTCVQGMGSGPSAHDFLRANHVATIIENLRNSILSKPDGLTTHRRWPKLVKIHDIKLEIGM